MEIFAFVKGEPFQLNGSAKTYSPALQGSPLSNDEFKDWIANAENAPTFSLEEAKDKWARKRMKLQELIK